MNFTFLKINLKYIIVIILFLFLFIFGRHFGGTNDNNLEQLIVQKEKETENMEKGVYNIRLNDLSAKLEIPVNYKKDDSYRIFFNVDTAYGRFADKLFESRPIDISVCLVSNYGEEQLIDNIKLAVPTKIISREIKFTSELDASKLIIKHNDSRTTGELTISNVRSYNLSLGKAGLDGLKPTISGGSNTLNAVFGTAADNNFSGKFPFVFTRKKQSIGQIFSSNYEQISSVDLALSWRGTGGSGNYLVELREVKDGGHYSDVLSHYYFNQETLQDNLIGANTYRIPLAANLEKGKKYIVCINNNNVTFNLINTLEVGSTNSKDNELPKAIINVSDKKTNLDRPLFLKINEWNWFKFEGDRVLNGAIIQDLGNGVGQYSYESIGESTDFLDLDRSDPYTLFDNSVNGIITPAKEGNSFYYKFNTVYPYRIMKVILNQDIPGVSKDLLSYSYDGESWTPINQNKNGDLTVEQTIKPLSDQQTILYIKVACNSDDAKYKKSINFGIKSIKVQALIAFK